MAVIDSNLQTPSPIEATSDGQVVVVWHAWEDFSHVEITTDPPAPSWTYNAAMNTWTGETTATSGSFFGVVCSDNSCSPYDWNFTIGKRNDIRITNTCPLGPLVACIIGSVLLAVVVAVIMVKKMRW